MSTHGVFLLAHVDGRLERVEADFPLTLARLQELVGGFIESVRLTPDIVGCINEEGRLEPRLPDNARYPNLCGPVLLFSDWEDPESEEGGRDFGPLTDAQLRMLEGGGVGPVSSEYMRRSRTIPDEEFTIRIVDPNADRPKGKG